VPRIDNVEGQWFLTAVVIGNPGAPRSDDKNLLAVGLTVPERVLATVGLVLMSV
jgi:hypothetical protein